MLRLAAGGLHLYHLPLKIFSAEDSHSSFWQKETLQPSYIQTEIFLVPPDHSWFPPVFVRADAPPAIQSGQLVFTLPSITSYPETASFSVLNIGRYHRSPTTKPPSPLTNIPSGLLYCLSHRPYGNKLCSRMSLNLQHQSLHAELGQTTLFPSPRHRSRHLSPAERLLPPTSHAPLW